MEFTKKYDKICVYCGKSYISKRSDAKYCSDSCRSLKSKENTGAEPFMGIPTRESVKLEMAEVEKEVIKKYPNEEHSKLTAQFQSLEAVINTLKAQKEEIQKALNSTVKNDSAISGALLGAGFGIALGGGKNSTERGMNLLAGMLIGGGFGYLLGAQMEQEKEARKMEKLNELWRKLEIIDNSLNFRFMQLEATRGNLRGTNKYIEETSKTTVIVPKLEAETLGLKILRVIPIEPAPAEPELQKELKFENSKNDEKHKTNIIPSNDLITKEFKTWNFKDDKWNSFLGSPEHGFSVMIHGDAGKGKSTFALKLASHLASNCGSVMYVSTEEGASLSMKNKLVNHGLATNYLSIAECKTVDELETLLKEKPTPFVFIDSVNHLNLSSDKLEEIKRQFPERSFIAIMQATKAGNYKGDSSFSHNADVVLSAEFEAIKSTKNRFAPLSIYENAL